MLNGCDQFRVAGMEVQIAIADRKDCSATTTNEASRAAKETFRMVRRSPTGISSAADTALECRENLRNRLCHDPFFFRPFSRI